MNNISLRASKVQEGQRTATFIASTSRKDRHNTVVNQNGWNLDNFNKNGVIGYQHQLHGSLLGSDPDDIIGIGRAYIQDANLMVDIRFEEEGQNAKADKIYNKVKSGILNAVSVGFISIGGGVLRNDETQEQIEMDEDPRYIPDGFTYFYRGQELIEISIVNIPSNPEALKVRLMEDIKKSKDNFIEQAKIIEKKTDDNKEQNAPINRDIEKIVLWEIEQYGKRN